eukprot:750038-Hanusia_phi.AAC.2
MSISSVLYPPRRKSDSTTAGAAALDDGEACKADDSRCDRRRRMLNPANELIVLCIMQLRFLGICGSHL